MSHLKIKLMWHLRDNLSISVLNRQPISLNSNGIIDRRVFSLNYVDWVPWLICIHMVVVWWLFIQWLILTLLSLIIEEFILLLLWFFKLAWKHPWIWVTQRFWVSSFIELLIRVLDVVWMRLISITLWLVVLVILVYTVLSWLKLTFRRTNLSCLGCHWFLLPLVVVLNWLMRFSWILWFRNFPLSYCHFRILK